MKDNKEISLFIDTATKSLEVGVKFGDKVVISKAEDSKKTLELTNLIIEQLEKEMDFDLQQVDSFYCLLGPGSNTGIRLGLTIPKTIFAFNPKIKLYGTDTLKVYLYNNENSIAALSDRGGNLFIGEIKNNEFILTKIDKKDVDSLDINKEIVIESSDSVAKATLQKYKIKNINVVEQMILAKDIFEDYSNKDEEYLPIYFQEI